MKRSCGIIMPVFSLPSPYGIGTLGQASYDFIDFLKDAGQSWWQMLPLGPTGYGDSPYQSFSTYAGNPYFIDLDLLKQDGLLTQSEILSMNWGNDLSHVDYETIYCNRFSLLKKATERGWERDQTEVQAFMVENESWLPDYALYMAIKQHFDMKPWAQWPDEAIRLRDAKAMESYREKLSDKIRILIYVQYLFFQQWNALCEYAHTKGIGIIGDLPIYVSMDSADVWADPKFFQLDSHGFPTEVAGVPPDYFCEDGQLWGNPLYNWDAMQKDGYGWWIQRIDGAVKLYDVIRIDHFRGFESYWAVPYGETTARNGHWIKGPGMNLLQTLLNQFPKLQFIAEDLGFLTPAVYQLLADSGLPGMKILEFAFDSREPSNYLPHRYPTHCVCYTGTHDNAPLAAWKEEVEPDDLALAVQYLGLNEKEGFHWGILRGGMSSVAELFMAQLQDYLGLGAEARINIPGEPSGNWQWRLLPNQLTAQLTNRLAEMSHIYGR
ncbi:MAG: 4-alpha-glucanotransferase [Eubacteriales bacterium]|nr:4-alpha-glucanotransferase [Eubacteriales bacterium]